MTRWFAVPFLIALLLAGCGQTSAMSEPPEAGLRASDCALEAALAMDQQGTEIYEFQEIAARTWPQVDDSDLKAIIKSIADARGPERVSQINLAFQSLLSWRKVNCSE